MKKPRSYLSIYSAHRGRRLPLARQCLAVSTTLANQLVPLLGGPLLRPHPSLHVIAQSYWLGLPGPGWVREARPLQLHELPRRGAHQRLVVMDCDDWLLANLPEGVEVLRFPTGGRVQHLAALLPQLLTVTVPPERMEEVPALLAKLASACGFAGEGEGRALLSLILRLRDATLHWTHATKAQRAALVEELRELVARFVQDEWPVGLHDLPEALAAEAVAAIRAQALMARFADAMLDAVPTALVRDLGYTRPDGGPKVEHLGSAVPRIPPHPPQPGPRPPCEVLRFPPRGG